MATDHRAAVQAALDDHNPRPTDDPLYVPYWARGNYARTHATKYTLSDGTQIAGGAIQRLGHGRPQEVPQLREYRRVQESATEGPRKAEERGASGAGSPDAVSVLMKENRTPELRRQLCVRFGIDWSIVESAPNPGVGAMRLANAIRGKIG